MPSRLQPDQRAALGALARELMDVFGDRFRTLAAYALERMSASDGELRSLALVDTVTFDDLAACAARMPAWRTSGLAAPLLLSASELERSLDVFPLEYGAILADHVVVAGDGLGDLRIAEADLRRACELQAKSHLIHLREGFLEAAGDPGTVAELMAASAPAFDSLLGQLARLDASLPIDPGLAAEVRAAAHSSVADPTALFARYVGGVERLWSFVDTWRQ